jgi:hypothetical protein
MDNVQNCDGYITVSSSQTYGSCLRLQLTVDRSLPILLWGQFMWSEVLHRQTAVVQVSKPGQATGVAVVMNVETTIRLHPCNWIASRES